MIISSTASTLERVEIWLTDTAVKGALLFALAGIVALILIRCRASAAQRHFVWLIAVIASLAMPLLSLVLPTWTIPIRVAQNHHDRAPTSIQAPLAFAEARLQQSPIRRSAHGPAERKSLGCH